MSSRAIYRTIIGERLAKRAERLRARILETKLHHPLVIAFVAGFSLLAAGAIAFFGWTAGVVLVLGLLAIPLSYIIISFPTAGIIASLAISYLIGFAEKFTEFPVGTAMDGILGLLIFGFFLKQKKRPDWKIFKNPVSIILLLWIAYNFLQLVNPFAESRLAWVYTIRTVALVLVSHYVFLYHIRTKNMIRIILKVWIALSFIAALYGLNQQLFGFFPFEQKWLDANPTAVSLYFIGGVWRKFSIFSDPVTFSYNMVITAVLCIGLMTGPLKTKQKIILGIIAATCFTSMLFSGTRGAYVLIPVSLGLFLILRFNKYVLIFALIAGAAMTALIFMPTDNLAIRRFQSAFSPEYDASFNVRKNNQKMIQPYIQTHPIGGKLGSTGTWGQRFSPNSFLANFPPDSDNVRVAVETGPLGLILFCTLIFVVLRIGIRNYYRIHDPELKSYCLGMVLALFALHIGNYPQEAFVQYPTNVMFALIMTLILSTRSIDKNLFEKKTLTTIHDDNKQGNHSRWPAAMGQ